MWVVHVLPERSFRTHEVQEREKRLEAAAHERVKLENELCELEAELSAAQHDLKHIVGEDLQLGHALTEIEGLRKQVVQSQEDRAQMLSQVHLPTSIRSHLFLVDECLGREMDKQECHRLAPLCLADVPQGTKPCHHECSTCTKI